MSLHVISFTRPSFHCISTASDKQWGEKARAQGYHLNTPLCCAIQLLVPCHFTDSALISSSLSTHVYTDHVDSGGKDLIWPDIGFELIIPQNAVPESQTIRIAVVPSKTSPFPLPFGMELLSLVYLIIVSPEMKFLKYIGLSLKHHANLENRGAASGMTFVVAAQNRVTLSTQDHPQLRPLEGGVWCVGVCVHVIL